MNLGDIGSIASIIGVVLAVIALFQFSKIIFKANKKTKIRKKTNIFNSLFNSGDVNQNNNDKS